MPKNTKDLSRWQFLAVMAVFGALGPIVRAIGLPSAVTACLRAWISALSLVVFLLFRRPRPTREALRRVFLPMAVSGILIAGDWIGLFTSYGYTTIATATVCYYVTPILVLLASPLVLNEKLTRRKAVCCAAASWSKLTPSGVSM